MLSVVCWKWGDKIHEKKGIHFTDQHVNTLYAMLRRHLHMPFELVCITDIFTINLHPQIRIIPLWNDYREMGGCFVRLKVFSRDFEKILGNNRFVSIDLDCIITDDITPLFDRNDDFIIWGEEWRKWVYCGSLWMMNSGARPKVWEHFNAADYKKNNNGRYSGGTDQRHINVCLYPGEQMWTERDGVYSFRTDIMRYEKRKMSHYGVKKIYGGDGNLPSNAKIIFFNGKYDPSQSELQEQYPWIIDHWRR